LISGFKYYIMHLGGPDKEQAYMIESRERECKMAADISEILESIIEKMDLIEADEIPNIDLYMDQVTTFMESHLGNLKRNPEDKVLTKTMINNYAKTELLPSPDKKRYSKNHVIILTFIYYFKNVLSISDIKTLMRKITAEHFKKESSPKLEEIYNEVLGFQPDIVEMVKKDLEKKTEMADRSFNEVTGDAEYLKLFSLLCFLSFDVYLKKTLIEAVIDRLELQENEKKEKKVKEKVKEKKNNATNACVDCPNEK